MKRTEKGPNRVRQTVRGLEPGRLYSLKLISMDLLQTDWERKLPISIALEGTEMIDALCFQAVYRGSSSCRDSSTGRSYSGPYLNYHRLVFRAAGRTGELTICDSGPGETENQELACNFVELQPYYAGP